MQCVWQRNIDYGGIVTYIKLEKYPSVRTETMLVLIMANISGHPIIPDTKQLGPPNLPGLIYVSIIQEVWQTDIPLIYKIMRHCTGCNEGDGAMYVYDITDISNSNHFY